jgi:hypothetical protein
VGSRSDLVRQLAPGGATRDIAVSIETPEEDLGAAVTLPRAPTVVTGTYALLTDGRTVEIMPVQVAGRGSGARDTPRCLPTTCT